MDTLQDVTEALSAVCLDRRRRGLHSIPPRRITVDGRVAHEMLSVGERKCSQRDRTVGVDRHLIRLLPCSAPLRTVKHGNC
jgi:hypothetical protein